MMKKFIILIIVFGLTHFALAKVDKEQKVNPKNKSRRQIYLDANLKKQKERKMKYPEDQIRKLTVTQCAAEIESAGCNSNGKQLGQYQCLIVHKQKNKNFKLLEDCKALLEN